MDETTAPLAVSNPPGSSTNRYSRSPFGPSPPTNSFRPEMFAQKPASGPLNQSFGNSASPSNERYPAARPAASMVPNISTSVSDPVHFGFETRPVSAVIIRRLPLTIGAEALRSMLIFAGDLIDTEFIRSIYPEDHGFATAVARFETPAGALEAQQKLHGKPNTTKEATMIVEAHSGAPVSGFERRNTIDSAGSRAQTSSASSVGSGVALAGRSRFGSTFQLSTSSEKVSPPLTTASSSGGVNAEFPIPENSAHFQSLFSPTSPLSNGIDGQHRVSGKSVINDDAGDDETGELLKDPVAYAKNGPPPLSRRQTNPQIPVSSFGRLSLSSGTANIGSGMASPISSGLVSPRGAPSAGSILSPMSPAHGLPQGAANGSYGAIFSRPQYPPVNPADQNPPCNTLYVGNLPIDTSEDELKSIFSKQRGYKRLCFRTKQNGPMCFVEFEDVAYATKALNDLYGQPLHNSVKGGIRLSFSKNPLGVRSGQTGGLGQNAMMGHPAMPPGYGNLMMNGGSNFSTVSGPPPGLATPPGFMGGAYRSPPATALDGSPFANPFGLPQQDFSNQLSPRSFSGGVPPSLGSGTYGREGNIVPGPPQQQHHQNHHHHHGGSTFGGGSGMGGNGDHAFGR